MKLWDWESGRCLWSYAMPGAAYVMSSFSSTSEWFVGLDSTGELTMWRMHGAPLPDDDSMRARERRGLEGLPLPVWSRRICRCTDAASVKFVPT